MNAFIAEYVIPYLYFDIALKVAGSVLLLCGGIDVIFRLLQRAPKSVQAFFRRQSKP